MASLKRAERIFKIFEKLAELNISQIDFAYSYKAYFQEQQDLRKALRYANKLSLNFSNPLLEELIKLLRNEVDDLNSRRFKSYDDYLNFYSK